MRHHPSSPSLMGSDAVGDALRAQPRVGFLPAGQRAHAREDRPLPLMHGLTSSQPSTVAAMLTLLDVPRGAHVLDVGAGSGWTTALLAHLVGPDGSVVGVELDPELAAWGAANLARTEQPWARLIVATPGVLGLPDEAPFDRILVSAEARVLPRSLVDQMGDHGRLVIPVAGELLLVRRTPEGGVDVTGHGGYRFVPLR